MKEIITYIRTLAALLIASATFVACSNDDNIIGENQQPVNPTGKYTMTINASKGGDAGTTRALSIDDSGAKNVLNATWATTENVYVKKGETWATGSLQPDANAVTATLKGTFSGITIEAGDELTLQFPHSGTPDYSGQVGTLEDIAANFDYATATVTVASVSATGNINPTEATTTFTNQQAIVKFTLKYSDGTTSLSASELTVSDGTNTYTVTPDSETDEIYVAIPDISDKTVTLTATDGSNYYTYKKTGVTFTNGQYYEITVKMTEKPATDLSMVDCAGNARAEDEAWTANCYMVHTAGDYKLPLVYGNAIKNGEVNTTAFNPGGTTSDRYCANFTNHAGTDIDAPWITKDTGGEGVNKGMGITVASAELLWQDAEGLITAVGIDGDYLTLTVGKNATAQEGNAVIAAKTIDGTIVWSWHIWVTKQTFASLKSINTGSHTYQVTNVNLGWVGDPVSEGYCTYYQWGRKDAFIPSAGNGSNNNHTVYDISGNTVTGITYKDDGTEAPATITISDNIKYPTTFYVSMSNGYVYGSCNTTYYNMWDAQNIVTGDDVTTATKKTVYDPCPPGFCVPTSGLYHYATQSTSSWDETNKGRTWYGIFFPAMGSRSRSLDGNLSTASSAGGDYYRRGDYWSASPYNSDYDGGEMYCVSEGYNMKWTMNNRTYGFSVRAVAEE